MKLKIILLLFLNGFFDHLQSNSCYNDHFTPFVNFFNWKESEKLKGGDYLREKLKENIFGQPEAVDVVVSALEAYAYGLNDSTKPIASLLFYGPVGVGKTELVLELCRQINGLEKTLIHLDMSDYSNPLTDLSRLIGSYDNTKGDLTSRIESNTSSIVLIENIDKASLTVLSVFKQIFQSGYVTDGSGKRIDCTKCLFIATSNLGSQKLLTLASLGKTHSEILEALSPEFIKEIGEIFYDLEPIQFNPLSSQDKKKIVKRLIADYLNDIKDKKHIQFIVDDSLAELFEQIETDDSRGALTLKELIHRNLRMPIVNAIKKGFFSDVDQARLYMHDGSVIIQKVNSNEFLSFEILREKKHEKTVPFRLDDLLTLESRLNEKVIGQSEPVKVTVASLIRYAARVRSSKGPIASLLYLGPTGVGKTQLAKEIASALYGSEHHLVRLDMSEYSEPHSVSRLIGSPPGYMNHEEGGQLTESLKRNPYAIVLLDEIEKAHTNVLRAFLQVFDEGHLSDAKGIRVDCTNAIFILTTNIGSETILNLSAAGGFSSGDIVKVIQPEVIQRITPELYNRLEPIAFLGLTEEAINQLISKMLEDAFKVLREQKQIIVEYDESVNQFLKTYGFDYELGARPLNRLIQNAIITPIAMKIVAKEIQEGDNIQLTFYDDQLMIFINSKD